MVNLTDLNDLSPINFLYDKTYLCPVCETSFTSKTVKAKRIRLISKDTDFMPEYSNLNSLFYDVVICPVCGYSALVQFFNKIKKNQIELIRANVSTKFKFREYPDILDIETSIERYKLALVNTLVKNSTVSETACIYLRLGWLYRLKKDTNNELKFLEQAYFSFKKAFEEELPPICGMDLPTVMYLIGELARRLGNNSEASEWFSRVILSKNTNRNIKELARDQRNLIKTRD